MRIDIDFSPAYAMARVTLDQGESAKGEAGAMMAMTPTVDIATSTQGGIMKGLKRSVLGGESFFMNTFTATGPDAEVIFAPALPGDIIHWQLEGRTVFLQSGSYLASSMGIEVDSKWGGAKTFFSKEGLFMLKCTGTGDLLVSSYGAIVPVDLAAGQTYVVDTGHMVGWDEGVDLRGPEGRQLEVDDARRRGSRGPTHRSGSGLRADPQPGELRRVAHPEAPHPTRLNNPVCVATPGGPGHRNVHANGSGRSGCARTWKATRPARRSWRADPRRVRPTELDLGQWTMVPRVPQQPMLRVLGCSDVDRIADSARRAAARPRSGDHSSSTCARDRSSSEAGSRGEEIVPVGRPVAEEFDRRTVERSERDRALLLDRVAPVVEAVDCRVASCRRGVGWVVGGASAGGEVREFAVGPVVGEEVGREREDHVAGFGQPGIRHQDVQLEPTVQVDQAVDRAGREPGDRAGHQRRLGVALPRQRLHGALAGDHQVGLGAHGVQMR